MDSELRKIKTAHTQNISQSAYFKPSWLSDDLSETLEKLILGDNERSMPKIRHKLLDLP